MSLSRQEYERRYTTNFRVTGFGPEIENHFPCPFCAAPEWYVVRAIDFAIPREPGEYRSRSLECKHCGRAAQYVSRRDADGSVTMALVQTAGEDPPDYVPSVREAA